MKPMVAGTLTALLLGLMIYLGSRGPARGPDAPARVEETGPHPAEEAIRALIRAGDEGDVEAYLGAFVGPLQTSLEREVAERGREAFAEDLIRAASARKSHAVYAAEPDGEDSARVGFEAAYPDRNERQTYRLVRSDDAWKIAGVSEAKGRQPPAKFGAAVVPIEPDVEAPASPKVGLTVETGDGPDAP